MIKFKGVREPLRVGVPRDELQSVIKLVAIHAARTGREVTITSLNDHIHAKNSCHYDDCAADFQITNDRGIPDKDAMNDLASFLRENLGPGYDLVWNSPNHYNHIHVEYDVRQREPRKQEDIRVTN
tara:strand:+ start:744 stop:1121 length:378 start_codon:yes stop_codon:yes gene_type:complete